jgi:putative FmdB family regulatory protein
MPLYSYTCDACGHEFDKVVPSTIVAVSVACPSCDSPKVTRGFGLPAVAVAPPRPATNCRGVRPPCGAVGCGQTEIP